jgi:soluble lytic murein transglycosylase
MTQRYLVHSIPVRWRKRAPVAAAALAIALACLSAAPDPALDLKAGVAALDGKRFQAAVAILEPLAKRVPKLADYAGWFTASADFGLRNYGAIPGALAPVWKQTPASPLVAKASLLEAQAYELNGAAQDAVDILRKNYAVLPQPQGDLALATAFTAAGDLVSGAVYNQRVYYGFPGSSEAAQADAALGKLRAGMGDSYPPSMPNAMLSRALKMLQGGQTQQGRKELDALVPQLGGAERDLARVRLGIIDYDAKEYARARAYFTGLETSSPDPDAQRLYYLLLCAQHLNEPDEAAAILNRLGQLYPDSSWRMQGLVAVANHYLTANQPDLYEPLFRICYEGFPHEPQAASCHWKFVWSHYLRRKSDAPDLLRAHLREFPSDDSSSGALYFLGRLSEDAHDTESARTYYGEVARQYPNQYYASQARERLRSLGSGPAANSVASQFLKTVAFPQRARTVSFQLEAAAAARVERAHLLASAGLDDFAAGELRFGAQSGEQPQMMAMELASLSSQTKPDQAIRYIKRYASGYMFLPLDSAPREFWTIAFPLPYRQDLERYAKQNDLDVFLMAALIRQESEFDPKAVSRADARGLAQIMPATGRELSRRLKVPRFTVASLFQPATNLQLGTFYLKSLTNQTGGNVEAALAAYDAGLTRARAWLGWGEFREPAEFVETVPFSETRNYVQTVLRNADVYRRLYGSEIAATPVP